MQSDLAIILTTGTSLVGVFTGALLTLVTTRRNGKSVALKARVVLLSHDLQRAAEQVAAYHVIETLMATDIAARRGIAPRTVKTEFRNRVEEQGYARPRWTDEDARVSLETALEPNE